MALGSSGSISIGKNEIPLSIVSVVGNGTAIANASITNASSVNVGDVIIVTGAIGTEQEKLNGNWIVCGRNANNIFFNIYTSNISNFPNNNIITTGTYSTNLGTWVNIKKSSISIELGKPVTTTININDANTRLLANVVTPNSPIKFSDFYSKYLAAAYIYSGLGDEVAQRYIFSMDAVAPMGSTTGNPFQFLSGTGNYTTSIFGGGYVATFGYTNQRRKYTYATDIRSTSGTLSTTRGYAAAIGNATYAVFGGGKNASGDLYSTDKYTYSTDTFSLEASKMNNSGKFIDGSAVGNETFGLFSFGQGGISASIPPYNIRYTKYTYSDSSVTTGTFSSTQQGDNRAASSGPTYGLFVGGGGGGLYTTTTYSSIIKYTYGTNTTSVSGTSLANSASNIGGSGNSTTGYFFNGSAGTTPTAVLATRKYNYSNDVLTNASTLISIPYVMDATSSSPGGF